MSTFNFLCDERRYVAGGFIPPMKTDQLEDEFYITEGDRTPETDMLEVMQRVAKLKGQSVDKLPEISDDKKDS